jgi:hypothetical protein
MLAGEALDFAVGYGIVPNYNNDSTGLDVSIDAVVATPEPASVALVLSGLGVIGAISRRRKIRP